MYQKLRIDTRKKIRCNNCDAVIHKEGAARLTEIKIDSNGNKVVVIDKILFSGKRRIDWKAVENYLKVFIGNEYVIDETDDLIYIGSDFPDEYTSGKYSSKAFGTIGRAKANASQAIPELIKVATNIIFQKNMKEKHKINAKYGWYRCTARFTVPTCDDKGKVTGQNTFYGRMIIRCDADGKKYLYDIIDIKKET